MLHEAIFLATCLATNVTRQVARKISRVTPLQWQQNVALRVARKVEISSTFRDVARQIAACDMSTATCNAILRKLGNQSPSFARRRFQAGGERIVNNFQRGRCKLRKKYCERVTPPLQLAMFFSRHRCETSCKKNCLV